MVIVTTNSEILKSEENSNPWVPHTRILKPLYIAFNPLAYVFFELLNNELGHLSPLPRASP